MATMRISGIMSGFDTDTMIKDLMKAESARVDKVKKERQYIQWQQEGFREIISKLKTFQSNYFDVLNSTQNMRSATSFAKFSYSVKSGGVDTNKVSVVASASVVNKSVTIDSITQLASKDKWTGNEADLRGIKTQDLDINALKTSLTTAGKSLEFTLGIGNNAKSITVNPADFSNITELKDQLNSKISQAFGTEYASLVTVDGAALEFDFAGTEVNIVKLGANSESMMGLFNVESKQSSTAFQTKTIGELFGLTNATLSSVAINGKTIALDETDSISKMIQKVNASEANVNLSYDTLRDRFVLESKVEGAVNNITFGDASNAEALLGKLFNVPDLIDGNGDVVAVSDQLDEFNNPIDMRQGGLNAQLSINGVAIVQSNNNFSLDGINYSLKETSATAINIGIETDTTSIIDNIKNFVKEYNDIVDYITGKLSEKKNYDYAPLTDEEKEALTEDEIKKWEEKAKAGMLKGSSELSSMLTELRNAVISPIEGVGISMAQIGISSTSYMDRGKLTIDETKLKSALENNYDDVVQLFTKQSTTTYNDNANRATRNKENGIGSRFDDIIKDYIRTTRDSNGQKGKLIIKAGVENDASQFSNDFQKRISGYDDRIADLLDYLANRENYYYTMFSKMESALSQMESQASSLMSQLGS